MRNGRYEEAYALSRSLVRSSVEPGSSWPPACLLDEPYQGEAQLLHLSDGTLRIQLQDQFFYDVLAPELWTLWTGFTMARGFLLDGQFVLASHEEVQQGSGAWSSRASRFAAAISWTGSQRMAVVPVCAGDV